MITIVEQGSDLVLQEIVKRLGVYLVLALLIGAAEVFSDGPAVEGLTIDFLIAFVPPAI